MNATIHSLRPGRPLIEIRCDGCGILADAACDCGVGYQPVKALDAAIKAVEVTPTESNCAIADRLGINEITVRRARKLQPRQNVEVEDRQSEKRIGLDGRTRRMPTLPSYTADDVDEEEGVTLDMVEGANAAIRRRVFMKCADYAIRRAEQGAGLKDARGSEIDKEILQLCNRVLTAWSSLRAELKRRR